MSFSMTVPQMEALTKSVTRRWGWASVSPGDTLMAVEKAQGLKKGEHIKKLYPIRVVTVVREPLELLLSYQDQAGEMYREGFLGMHPTKFIDMLCRGGKHTPADVITRIEFAPVLPMKMGNA